MSHQHQHQHQQAVEVRSPRSPLENRHRFCNPESSRPHMNYPQHRLAPWLAKRWTSANPTGALNPNNKTRVKSTTHFKQSQSHPLPPVASVHGYGWEPPLAQVLSHQPRRHPFNYHLNEGLPVKHCDAHEPEHLKVAHPAPPHSWPAHFSAIGPKHPHPS